MKREADLTELFAAERAVRPAAEVAERCLARLVDGLGAAPLVAPVAVEATRIGWVVASKWALGGLVLGIGGAGAASFLSNAGAPAEQSVVSAARPTTPTQTASAAPRPPTSPLHDAPELTTSSSAQTSAAPRRARSPLATPSARGSVEQETFDRELRLINAAKAELDRGRAHLAKVWLGEHLQGAVVELGPSAEGSPSVVGDYYVFSEVSPTDATKIDHWVSPFLMPEQKTQLAQTEAGLAWDLAAGYMFWEKRGEDAAIWSAPLTGGEGAVLVPGGRPTGMVVEGGYLYWTDFATNQLERIPVAGGTREALGKITFGGGMSAGFGATYWSGPTGQLYRFKAGGQEENVFEASPGHKAERPVPVEGGAYFQAGGFSCRELYYLPLSGGPQLLLSGFERTARIVAVTAQHLYVQDEDAIYRLER